jgi:hypothetical protein
VTGPGGGDGAPPGSLAIVVDDYALAAFPTLEQELAREGALVMRAFKGHPNPNLLRRYRGAAVVGGPDRTGLLARLERATASLASPVVAVLPPGVSPSPELRGPGVVDLVPAGARGVGRRVVLMAGVPVVTAPRARPPASAHAASPPARTVVAADGVAGAGGDVVAVASSTGGVWVLAALLRALPRAGRAVLVAQHMEQEFVPFFAEWLGDASGWPTVVVEDVAPLRDGAAYVPAGGYDLVLDGGLLRALPASSRFVPCADRLLSSAARAGERATGVVLSGMGADGADGLAAIARAGGRAICQSPESAVVPSMPESALRRARGAVSVAPAGLATAIALAPHGAATSGASARR